MAGWCFLAGLVLFSGGLFVMALAGVTGLGAVVPVGGVAFLAGWAALFYAGWRYMTTSAKDRNSTDSGDHGDQETRNG